MMVDHRQVFEAATIAGFAVKQGTLDIEAATRHYMANAREVNEEELQAIVHMARGFLTLGAGVVSIGQEGGANYMKPSGNQP